MEDFLAIIALIVYLVVAASGKKKKAQKKEQKRRIRREQDLEFAQAFEQHTQPVRKQEEANGQESVHEDCAQQRLHLHDVPQTQLHEADEGEDPCHAGDAPVQQAEAYHSFDEENGTQSEFAQDVLRGVIMSEVLMRPCDRMAVRQNRRSAV